MINFKIAQILNLSLSLFSYQVRGHGYLKTPRSRNYIAEQDGTWQSSPGVPKAESCAHCLNTKEAHKVCGKTNTMDYDVWNDSLGNQMPWASQGVYEAGDSFIVESHLSTNHAGHMEIWLCPDINNPTQECFESNPTTLIQDEYYGGPVDSDYPERAYFATGQKDFKFTYKLPDNVIGDRVLMQWRYVTANSCFPPGYKGSDVTARLRELGWLRSEGMGACNYPLSPTGGIPEQFWNCAEITIHPKGDAPPSIPAPQDPPVPAPVSQPVEQPAPMPVHLPPSPTESTSSRPSLRSPPVTPPAQAPVEIPPTGDGTYCCSYDISTCADDAWCAASESRCTSCSGTWINPEEQNNCIAKWGTCTNDINGCCAPTVCTGSSIYYKQCL